MTDIRIDGSVIGNIGDGNFENSGQIALGDIHNYPKPEFPIHYLPLPNPNFTGRET